MSSNRLHCPDHLATDAAIRARGTPDAAPETTFLRPSEAIALSTVVNEVYGLALRMLWHPADAEAATRAIFRSLRQADSISQDGSRRFAILGVAVKFLLTTEPSLFERQRWTFNAVAADLRRGFDHPLPPDATGADLRALEAEVRTGCSQTVLLCLDRPHRMAYLLATSLALDVITAAALLELDVPTYTARVSHAERRVRTFLEGHCGLVNGDNPCRCSRRLGRALITGRVSPRRLLFIRPFTHPVTHPVTRPVTHPATIDGSDPTAAAPVSELEVMDPTAPGSAPSATFFCSQPHLPAPPSLFESVADHAHRAWDS